MDKQIINEEQFRKLVIKEAKRIFSEEETNTPAIESKKIHFDDIKKLINEMEDMNKSITSLNPTLTEEVIEESIDEVQEETKPERDLNVNEHNRKKNVKHVNEDEKDRWNRMLNYNVPKDEER